MNLRIKTTYFTSNNISAYCSIDVDFQKLEWNRKKTAPPDKVKLKQTSIEKQRLIIFPSNKYRNSNIEGKTLLLTKPRNTIY